MTSLRNATPQADQWRGFHEFAFDHHPAFRDVDHNRWTADLYPLSGFRDPETPQAAPEPVCARGLCDDSCCLADAVYDHLPRGLGGALRLKTNASVALFGNSVAMSNGFLSTKAAIAALGLHGWDMHMGYLPRKGGIDASHAALCTASSVSSDVVIIQFNTFLITMAMRVLVQNLQRHRSPPIIVAIFHCAMDHYTERERSACPFVACRGEHQNQTSSLNSAKSFAAQHGLLQLTFAPSRVRCLRTAAVTRGHGDTPGHRTERCGLQRSTSRSITTTT